MRLLLAEAQVLSASTSFTQSGCGGASGARACLVAAERRRAPSASICALRSARDLSRINTEDTCHVREAAVIRIATLGGSNVI